MSRLDPDDDFPTRPCGLVWDNLCDAPANGSRSIRGTCYACGQPVCTMCSVVTNWYHYGRHRIGFDCLREHDRSDELASALKATGR